jgi:hypothetical protein
VKDGRLTFCQRLNRPQRHQQRCNDKQRSRRHNSFQFDTIGQARGACSKCTVFDISAMQPIFCASVLDSQRRKIMANISKLIFGAAIAAVSVASPALAQYASHSSISDHHRKHLRIYNYSRQSHSPAFAPVQPPHDPRAQPYVYVPGNASGVGGM